MQELDFELGVFARENSPPIGISIKSTTRLKFKARSITFKVLQ